MVSNMDIQILNYSSYDSSTREHIWHIRSPTSGELNKLRKVYEAASTAREISPIFFNEILIANLNVFAPTYSSVMADSDQCIMWIHEEFFKNIIQELTVEELTSLFLHEAAHHIQSKLPKVFKQMLTSDHAWINTISYYPEIAGNGNWWSETTADIYAMSISGKNFITAIDKLYRLTSQHFMKPFNLENYPENRQRPSLVKRFEILDCYAHQKKVFREKLLSRMPMSTKRPDSGYQVITQLSKGENRRGYFESVAMGDSGYDFLESLLRLHPQVEILPSWEAVQPVALEDKKRQKEVEKFIHDVTTLMKLLLGSASLYVDDYGNFLPDMLPYSAVRANRGGLTRVALTTNGSIRRIHDELSRSGLLQEPTSKKIRTLYNMIKYPSFEQQREDLTDLTFTSKQNTQYSIS